MRVNLVLILTCTVACNAALAAGFVATQPLAAARQKHSATLLNNGKVLIAGGQNSSGALNSAELFDPATGTWSPAGTLVTARQYHTATLLADGRVLLAGGQQGASLLNNVEIYNPATNMWTAATSLTNSRYIHAAALLGNGKVLVAGGYNSGGFLNSTELYDPGTNTWSAAGNLGTARYNFASALLPSGKVFIVGGYGGAQLAGAEIFDPATSLWSPAAGMVTAREIPTATLLQNGKVLVAGGWTGSAGLNSAELYDPALNSWSPAGTMATARTEHSATRLSNGLVLIAGGMQSGGVTTNGSELYNPATNTWSATANLANPRNLHTGTLLNDGTVLIAGGNLPGSTTACEIYKPAPVAAGQSISVHSGAAASGTVTATDVTGPLSYSVVQTPLHGTLSFTTATGAFTFTAAATYSGADSFTFKANNGVADSNIATVAINVTNTAPTVAATGSPLSIVEGQSVSFAAAASDAENDALTYLWNFANGTTSTAINPSAAFAAAGVYGVTVKATDIAGASGTSNVVTVTVSRKAPGNPPVARFMVDKLVGFAGEAVQFDGRSSTDPENAIVSYAWNFGDGSNGAGAVTSKTYAAAGTYTVRLTVTDAEGLAASASKQIVVLSADQADDFEPFIRFKVRWDRGRENTDTLHLDANLNVGDALVAAGALVALEIAGQRFEGTLNDRLQSRSATVSWQLMTGRKKQDGGEVFVRAKIRKASLGASFSQAGAAPGGGPVDMPVRLEIAGRVFETLLRTEFRISKDGMKGSGEGEEP